jgi:hypothetical protein
MGKYGNLIQQAKAEGSELENQNDRKPESKKTRKPISKKARMTENQKTRKQESHQSGELVNLGVKVPLPWRRHWAAESKRQGVSMTEIIVAALIAEFGKPE